MSRANATVVLIRRIKKSRHSGIPAARQLALNKRLALFVVKNTATPWDITTAR